MKSFIPAISAVALTLALGTAVSAQGIVRGTERGVNDGAAVAGPVGGIVGGVVGGVTGGVAGLLGADQQPRFRDYVVQEHRSSWQYDRPVVVGAPLPTSGVEYYEVPQEYGASGYRYTVVNGQTVLVDPRTHRIVQVIE